jgi:uncharacterized protein YqjF (DUF2071 family)
MRAALDLLASPLVHGRAARARDHRPWPAPRRPWVMGQTWTDLLFAHWPVDPAALREAVPAQLPLDTFDGAAWVGVTPFAVRNLRARVGWPVPGISSFAEINVRTYVTVDGKPGIWFHSLDAGSPLAVAAARRLYRLPYFRTQMALSRAGDAVGCAARRTSPEAPAPASFVATYRPTGQPFQARPGSLEEFLCERYCLYVLDAAGRVLRADIHHPPWALQPAAATIAENTMGAELGLDPASEPLLHYAARQDVVFWPLG